MSVMQYSVPSRTIVKYLIVGVGGAGCNVVNRLVESGIDAARCIVVDTSAATRKNSLAGTVIQIGEHITGGIGTGGDTEKGRLAAGAAADRFEELFANVKHFFLG